MEMVTGAKAMHTCQRGSKRERGEDLLTKHTHYITTVTVTSNRTYMVNRKGMKRRRENMRKGK